METRIAGSLDTPRLGSFQAKPDMDIKLTSVVSAEVPAIATKQKANDVAVTVATAGKTQKELQAAVTEMNDFVQTVNRDIDFKLDDESGRVVVNITDRETGDVIRQIPSEEALRLAESLSEARSLLFKTEA